MVTGAEAVARVERLVAARGFASDPAVAEGIALAGIRAASLGDGSGLSASEGIPLPGVSCVHHAVMPPGGAGGAVFELAASSVQQAIDHSLVAHVLSDRLQRVGLCSLDPRLAENLDLVRLPGSAAVARLFDEPEPAGADALDATQVLEQARRALRKVVKCTGRDAGLVEYDGEGGADVVFAAAGAEVAPARAAARMLREAGIPAAALSVALVHPFPEAEVRSALAGARTVAVIQAPGRTSALAARLRDCVDEAAEVRTLAAGSPARILEGLGDLLQHKGVDSEALPSPVEASPGWRLGVLPAGPWGEEAVREVLAASSRLGAIRMAARTRLEGGATRIDWEGPEDSEGSGDLLIASHPAVLEPGGLEFLRPGGRTLVLAQAQSPEEAMRQLSPEVRELLRARATPLFWVVPPQPEEEEREGAPEMERAAALALAGAAAALVGGAERARAMLAAEEDDDARWLRLGAEGVRAVPAEQLTAPPVPEEVNFRPASRRLKMPAPAELDSPGEGERWTRAIHRFHRTGRAPVRLGPSLPFRPALLDALIASLREASPYPLVVTRTSDEAQPLAARPLREILREALEARPELGGDASVLGENLDAVVPLASRLLREAGGSAALVALLARVAEVLGRELGLDADAAKALGQQLAALREVLPSEARIVALRRELAVEIHGAAVEAVREPLRRAFRERLQRLREGLRDLLQLGLMGSPDGHSPQRLAAGLGRGADRYLDPEALSRTLPDGTTALESERRRRIEGSLVEIEKALEQSEGDRVLYLTPPGFELPPSSGRQCVHPDPLAAAIGCFDGAALRMAPLFRAMRVATLELSGQYRPERHDALLADLDWEGFTAEELALVPPVAVVTTGRRLRRRGQGSLSELLRSSRPVHVLVQDAVVTEEEAEDPSRFHLDLGYLVMAHREAFAAASSLARPERLAEALVRMVRAPRPGVAVLQLASPELEPWYPLMAEAALRGRACHEFVYDPDAGSSWAGRFDLGSNPQPERAWPLESLACVDGEEERSLELAFTFADAVALEPACARHVRVIPRVAWNDEIQRPVAEYLERFDPEGRDRSIPYLWVLDDAGVLQRAVITRALAMAARDRLRAWRVLQELAGYENAYAERAAAAAREQALAEAAREREELERAHAEVLAGARGEGARESMERLAAVLLRGGDLGLAAPTPAAPSETGLRVEALPPPVAEPAAAAEAAEEEEEEALALDEPYIDTPLCTSCNECTEINSRMFRYNSDKQATLADPSSGTYAELVKAAEQCPAHCIHPGRPRSDDATATPELIERAAKFA